MARYEVELRAEKRNLRLSDLPLTLGETVEIAGELWRVRSVKRASDPDAELRYICVPASACSQRGCGGSSDAGNRANSLRRT